MLKDIKEQIAQDVQEGKMSQEDADEMVSVLEMLNGLFVEEDTSDSVEQAKTEMFEAIEGNLDKGEATVVVLDHPENDGIQLIQYSNPQKTVELLIHAIGNVAEDNPEVLVGMMKDILEEEENE